MHYAPQPCDLLQPGLSSLLSFQPSCKETRPTPSDGPHRVAARSGRSAGNSTTVRSASSVRTALCAPSSRRARRTSSDSAVARLGVRDLDGHATIVAFARRHGHVAGCRRGRDRGAQHRSERLLGQHRIGEHALCAIGDVEVQLHARRDRTRLRDG